MITENLSLLFDRDLNRLKREIESYRTEANMWKTQGKVSNSAGNLVLHLCGNLQHFFGSTLGGSDYVRDREQEFSGKDFTRAELIDEVEKTRASVQETLAKLTAEKLAAIYPHRVFSGKEMTTEYFVVHLQGHLNYHLGQINYHRRLLDQD